MLDLTGERFGRLICIAATEERWHGGVVWQCMCDCGKVVKVVAGHLRSGSTKSCGCYSTEKLMEWRKATTKSVINGVDYSYEYKLFLSIKDRVMNEENPNYQYYGGKGIAIENNWLENFASFIEHIGPRPTPQHSLDRINPNLGYISGNVRWATNTQQARNRTFNKVNPTGVVGVRERVIDNNLYYFAFWYDLDGKQKEKCFSVRKFGKGEAFRLACEFRKSKLEELNGLGAGYSEWHGSNNNQELRKDKDTADNLERIEQIFNAAKQGK